MQPIEDFKELMEIILVMKPKQLSEWRGYVIIGIFIIAAILTPPDGLSQIMLALPMCALYELGVIAARLVAKKPEAAPT